MNRSLDVLNSVTIDAPCSAPWSAMHGDDRSRFCADCRQPVFDLSELTTAEATKLLSNAESLPCVRLYRRTDGRVMTADCPIGVRGAIWRRLRRRAAWAASLFAVLFLQACRTMTQGFPGPIQPNAHAQHGQDDRTDQPTPPADGNEGVRP
jgi:hypothetical protein